ncbi:MAG TPA: ParB/RepB/Spo0J family partition protein [Phycisphaerae bacterium]|jgi:ParB family chromosome partitioning protein
MNRSLSLSSLVASRRNPRRVKPDQDAHRQLVATIRAFGLLEPLIVRPFPNDPERFNVIAGNRRLAALKDIHRGNGHEVKVPCVIKDVDDVTADALSLTENFTQRAMHPLDEAQAFAELAAKDASGIEAVTAKFGVTERYVKQRIKLASLIHEVKEAFRDGSIDTATAEAFAAVTDDRQRQVWGEVQGQPRHAEHVRRIIAHGWIDASHALFDVASLPEHAVNHDLFSEQILVERTAFMDAQTNALAVQRQELEEQGWSEALSCKHEEFFPLIGGMEVLPREYDAKTTRKLAKLEQRREQLQEAMQKIDDNDMEAVNRIHGKITTLDEADRELQKRGKVEFSEATKATGKVFLVLEPDGSVRQEYRVARKRQTQNGVSGGGQSEDGSEQSEQPKPPTSEDLNDRQRASSFAHHTLAVREALLQNPQIRKRLLVMLLHENVVSEALAVRHDSNGVTIHATREEGFSSLVWERLTERHRKIDPFADSPMLSDAEAYAKVSKLSAAKLDALIDLLLVETLTAHTIRPTPLVQQLGNELKVNVRNAWRPDAKWLANYQKCQLAHLMAEFYGAVYNPATETRKKWELVEALATLFADAAAGTLDDKKLADRVNGWLPANLREVN